MKRLSIAFLVLLFVVNCGRGFQIVVNDDPFKNSKKVTLAMWHKVVEGSLDNYETTYEREIKSGAKQLVLVTFKFNNAFTTDEIHDLNNEAHILIGDKNYTNACLNVNFQNRLVGYSSGTYASIRNLTDLSVGVQLSLQQQIDIMTSNKLMYRFYSGNQPVTLEATPDQLVKVKEFIAYDPATVKK
jgi:hypothetical protein